MVKKQTGGTRKLVHKRWVRLMEGLLVLALVVGVGYFVSEKFDGKDPKSAEDQKGDKKETGIEVKTEPTGATLSLDGKQLKDKSNTFLKTSKGKHTVKLTLAGYDDQEVTVDLIENLPYELEHTFVKNGQTVVGTNDGKVQTTYAPDQLQTYTSDKFGYTIKYPKDWTVDTDPGGLPHFYNKANSDKTKGQPGAELEESLAILVSDNPRSLPPKAWFADQSAAAGEDQSKVTGRDVTVNGRAGYRVDTPYGFVPYTTTIFGSGTRIFQLQAKQNAPERAIYDQLVATFSLK